MAITRHPRPPLRRAAGVLVGVALAVLLTAAPAWAAGSGTEPVATEPAPQLSIAVDNGRTSAAAGDTLDYAITIRNLGTTDVVGLTVTQSMPAGLSFDAADSAGREQAGGVGWTIDLATAGEVVLHSTMAVTDTPPELLRLATVACASMSASGPPIVCASHSDQLPAGASAEEAATAAAAAPSFGLLQWYVAGGIAVVLIAMSVVVVVRRRTVPTR
jgi:uncharacterized repeat protein (TIGR01451 family)